MLLYVLFIIVPIFTLILRWRYNTKERNSKVIKILESVLILVLSPMAAFIIYAPTTHLFLTVSPTNDVFVEEKTIKEFKDEELVNYYVDREYQKVFASDSLQYWFANKYFPLAVAYVTKTEVIKGEKLNDE